MFTFCDDGSNFCVDLDSCHLFWGASDVFDVLELCSPVCLMDRFFKSIRVVPMFLGHKKNVLNLKIALKFCELCSFVSCVVKIALKVAINCLILKIALKFVELCSLVVSDILILFFGCLIRIRQCFFLRPVVYSFLAFFASLFGCTRDGASPFNLSLSAFLTIFSANFFTRNF
jgi:hypothetical protein